MPNVYIGIRGADLRDFIDKLEEGLGAASSSGFEIEFPAEMNSGGSAAQIVFSNDDMERDEMAGRIIVDMDE